MRLSEARDILRDEIVKKVLHGDYKQVDTFGGSYIVKINDEERKQGIGRTLEDCKATIKSAGRKLIERP